jgi:glycerol kinase
MMPVEPSVCFPALETFRAPCTDLGLLVGITAYTQRGHIARATLEATCFQTRAILDSMAKDSGKALTELAVDGGMTNSDLIMQVSKIPSSRARIPF